MFRRINRIIQDFLRPKRLAFGKYIWDRKNTHDKRVINKKIDMSKINSILFLRYDGKIGDMVVSTLLFREIKKVYPQIKIGVVARGAALDIIKKNDNISEIYEYKKGKESSLADKISKESYDIIVDFNEMLRVNQMKFIKKCNGKINIGLDKEEWNMFDISYKKDESKHISEMYKTILGLLDIKNPSLKYDLKIDEKTKKNLLKKYDYNKKRVLINPYAASKYRSFNKINIKKIIEKVLKNNDVSIFILGEPSRKDEILTIIKELDNENIFYPELKGMEDVISFLSIMDFIITPDTSIVHIASALEKPMIAVYRKDKYGENEELWGPNSKKAKQIFSIDTNNKKGEEQDINYFNIDEVIVKF